MEPDSCLEIVTNIHNNSQGDIYVKSITTDDDTTMKAVLQNEGNGKGRLPQNIPSPYFFADPSHRCKCVAGAIYKLAGAAKNISC